MKVLRRWEPVKQFEKNLIVDGMDEPGWTFEKWLLKKGYIAMINGNRTVIRKTMAIYSKSLELWSELQKLRQSRDRANKISQSFTVVDEIKTKS